MVGIQGTAPRWIPAVTVLSFIPPIYGKELSENFSLCDYIYFLHVPNNYHLEYDWHYYSVQISEGIGSVLKATISEVKICGKNNKLICRYTRSYKTFPLYITGKHNKVTKQSDQSFLSLHSQISPFSTSFPCR